MNYRFEQAPTRMVSKVLGRSISAKWNWNWEVDEIYIDIIEALEEKTKNGFLYISVE